MVNYKTGPGNYRSSYINMFVKTADQTVNNSEVLVADLHLTPNYRIDKRYYGMIILRIISPSAADIDFQITAIAGTEYAHYVVGSPTGAQTPVNFGSQISIPCDGSIQTVVIHYWMGGPSSNGNLIFKFAQTTATVGDTKLLEGSMLIQYQV